ncbi:MAG: indolepyruvate oxidoreductase subunit beta [Planctomycetes bacterium]|nr:indolepyruvate oxidoreductase subunit beta [Planctomycetota bacterium]
MRWSLVVAGIGGQGVLFVTRLLERVALASNLPVLGAETHGMSQRGGSVTTHFRVGPFASPLVRAGTADCLLGLSLQEALRNAAFPRAGSLVVVNARPDALAGCPVLGRLVLLGTDVRATDADGIAMDLGSPRLANVVLLGSALSHPRFPFRPDSVRAAILSASPPRFAPANREALERGLAAGLACQEPERTRTGIE